MAFMTRFGRIYEPGDPMPTGTTETVNWLQQRHHRPPAGAFDNAEAAEPFALSQPVGPDAANDPADVGKVQGFLRAAKFLPNERPASGQYDDATRDAVERYQSTFGLATDGLMNPDGPSIRLAARLSGQKAGVTKPAQPDQPAATALAYEGPPTERHAEAWARREGHLKSPLDQDMIDALPAHTRDDPAVRNHIHEFARRYWDNPGTTREGLVAALQTFASEGGFRKDKRPGSQTFGGITMGELREMQADNAQVAGIGRVRRPKNLTIGQLGQAYNHIMDRDMRPYGGYAQSGDEDVSAAMGDATFRFGRKNGGKLIADALSRTIGKAAAAGAFEPGQPPGPPAFDDRAGVRRVLDDLLQQGYGEDFLGHLGEERAKKTEGEEESRNAYFSRRRSRKPNGDPSRNTQ